MTDWNADLYLKFADERTRPARELLARVPLESAATAVDLGCGPGNSTALIAERFPEAAITGVDTSPAMLEKARAALPNCTFIEGDVATYAPEWPADLIFGNAVLQWLGDHESLFPLLMQRLAPGGALAIQMPDNLGEPSHRAMRETAADGPWAGKLSRAAASRTKILSTEAYYDLLAPLADEIDVWRTTYSHVMEGPAAIVTWLKATGLRPFLAPLDESEQTGFLAAYEARLSESYRPRADGKVLLHFPRLFIVARRKA
ncbi:trans-aconitate 2-methyltransferase [Consotaella salsifontis]|uniref:Trans-aconitate 2-methyltransferase n=1 Tax=Consotaella salsifontis TaxID=1365950 RepID=A0A1T4RZ00_9HYPH|nr:trans-aconitate 2-methyltransferase [Consotaella salsifontis]SKA21203.1 trans-aconitate 2-methyltransferase [Consotaella salsifontis]